MSFSFLLLVTVGTQRAIAIYKKVHVLARYILFCLDGVVEEISQRMYCFLTERVW